jgi:hypothetical protein
MSHSSRSGAASRWRRTPGDAVPQADAISPLCNVSSHLQPPESNPLTATRHNTLFKQRTLLVLCAAVTLANSVGYIAASAGGDPLAGLAAGVCAFGGTIGFFHEHTD